ncbi:hypothetical protein [Asanoa ferruginea]|nr:hypothetical protein [Asanoa ferruginea]
MEDEARPAIEHVTMPDDPLLVEAGSDFDWLTGSGGRLSWLEQRPSTGRSVVVSLERGQLVGYGVRGGSIGSSLHSYGGRPFVFLGSEGLVAVDASTGCVVGTGETADSFTYGDLEYDNGEVLAVRERESGDQLVALDRVRG